MGVELTDDLLQKILTFVQLIWTKLHCTNVLRSLRTIHNEKHGIGCVVLFVDNM